MLDTFKHFIFVTKTILFNFINYKLGRNNKKECLLNLSNTLSNKNILYSKIFQIISSENYLLDAEDNYILNDFNDNVRYNDEELYDIEELINDLNNNLNNDNDNEEKIILKNINPIQSGLVSVVYDAELNDNDIIIKVIRKNIREKLECDLNEIEKIINIFSKLPYIKNYNLNTIFSNNKNIILNQTNFLEEVDNIMKFYKNYENVDYIKIPKVYEKYTMQNNSIIVMEKLYGNTLQNVQNNVDSDLYGLLLIKFTMKCILYDRLYHSDLHSGNIFFIKEDNKQKLGIIDYGIVDTITKNEQNTFYHFFNEIFMNCDKVKSRNFIINNIIEPKYLYDNLNYDKKMELKYYIDDIIEKTLINTNNISHEWIYEINKILRKYNLNLSKNFCKIQLSLIISDSVGKKLCYNESNIQKIKKAIEELFCPDILEF
jgi:predicted unusual protein kinase regulating ubiquinone biosynthesis (AarF/ABC1/UbiB family)